MIANRYPASIWPRCTLRKCQMKPKPRKFWQLSLWRNEEDYLESLNHGWRLSSKTWNPVTSIMKQLMWFRIVHSGDWSQHLVPHLVMDARKWMN